VKLLWSSNAHLLVISKVVPKIWARTNSAMMGALTGYFCNTIKAKSEYRDDNLASLSLL
jgi:hypothetical protein